MTNEPTLETLLKKNIEYASEIIRDTHTWADRFKKIKTINQELKDNYSEVNIEDLSGDVLELCTGLDRSNLRRKIQGDFRNKKDWILNYNSYIESKLINDVFNEHDVEWLNDSENINEKIDKYQIAYSAIENIFKGDIYKSKPKILEVAEAYIANTFYSLENEDKVEINKLKLKLAGKIDEIVQDEAGTSNSKDEFDPERLSHFNTYLTKNSVLINNTNNYNIENKLVFNIIAEVPETQYESVENGEDTVKTERITVSKKKKQFNNPGQSDNSDETQSTIERRAPVPTEDPTISQCLDSDKGSETINEELVEHKRQEFRNSMTSSNAESTEEPTPSQCFGSGETGKPFEEVASDLKQTLRDNLAQGNNSETDDNVEPVVKIRAPKPTVLNRPRTAAPDDYKSILKIKGTEPVVTEVPEPVVTEVPEPVVTEVPEPVVTEVPKEQEDSGHPTLKIKSMPEKPSTDKPATGAKLNIVPPVAPSSTPTYENNKDLNIAEKYLISIRRWERERSLSYEEIENFKILMTGSALWDEATISTEPSTEGTLENKLSDVPKTYDLATDTSNDGRNIYEKLDDVINYGHATDLKSEIEAENKLIESILKDSDLSEDEREYYIQKQKDFTGLKTVVDDYLKNKDPNAGAEESLLVTYHLSNLGYESIQNEESDLSSVESTPDVEEKKGFISRIKSGVKEAYNYVTG